MKLFTILLAIAGFVEALTYTAVQELDWISFKLAYKRVYDGEMDEKFRKQVFMENKAKMDAHNERYDFGDETYQMGVNQFSDLNSKEFTRLMLTSVVDYGPASSDENMFTEFEDKVPPLEVDWRKRGAVTRVKNQKLCGACWAFAAVAAVESHYYIETHTLLSLSVQNVIDCTFREPYKQSGCCGGSVFKAFLYILERKKGIETEKSYPYKARLDTCLVNQHTKRIGIKGIANIPKGSSKNMTAAVAFKGPVAVTILGSQLQHYKSGIITTPCNGTNGGYHSLLVVGYGQENGINFWTLKNSWGNWGEKGYFRLGRDKRNLCNIVSNALYPLI